ncbi:hypothetical protein SAMN05216553_118133 [Lentzea fradiae]|uniref:DUF4878 domain-containing protein n=2 Tax=Lentzea fradiae TaxID=200378 RepID=A0A1G8AVI7_9PSEU|nr:hypothetical protein SAMN05216553_118133 [Lentzea fradiae]
MRYMPAVAVFCVLGGLTACGSDQPVANSPTSSAVNSPTSAPVAASTTTDPSAEIEAAVRAYSDAYLNGQGEAYDMLSVRCKERMTRLSFIELVTLAKQTLGPQQISTFKIDQQAGDLARVTYTYAAKPEIDQRSEPWVREDAVWKQDDC